MSLMSTTIARSDRIARFLPARFRFGRRRWLVGGYCWRESDWHAASGYLPSPTIRRPGCPAPSVSRLAIMIVAYDGPLKKTPLAPAAMGSCRVLSFLLGAAPCLARRSRTTAVSQVHPRDRTRIWHLHHGHHDDGKARGDGRPEPNLATGLLVTIIGAAVLAFAPSTAVGNLVWRVDPNRHFPILIGLIAFPVILRGFRLQSDPSPAKIQEAIRAGVLTIIPLAAAYALLGAGRLWGLIVFSLVIPAMFLALRLRVT